MMSKSNLRYFQLLSTQGVLIKFHHIDDCNELSSRSLDYYNMSKKDQEKYKIEIIKLEDIKSIEVSDKADFKKKSQYALELIFGPTTYYLVANDIYQLKDWQTTLHKSMFLSNWIKTLIHFFKHNQQSITTKLSSKLSEIMQFISAFDLSKNKVLIDFVESHEDKKKRKEDKVTESSASKSSSSVCISEQGTLRSSQLSKHSDEIPVSPKAVAKVEQKVQFKDFDIVEVIGQGSFGRVFKGRKKDDG
jgi:hypothetical protein